MKMTFVLLLLLISLIGCKGQNSTSTSSTPLVGSSDLSELIHGAEEGLVYFSWDLGNTWKKMSSGILDSASIGLGGVAVSNTSLAVAAKEAGIFEYNFSGSTWNRLPTEKHILESNIGAVEYFNDGIYVGTQYQGVFYSIDKGKTWIANSEGLANRTIRRFMVFEDKLYVGTNDGFYILDESTNKWELVYGEVSLQVNGATRFNNEIYLATNKGVYKETITKSWKNILPNHSVHNISSYENLIYAMTYNELLLTSEDGMFWQKAQAGLPKDLYTFNVIGHAGTTFAGQWDGVYRKGESDFHWKRSSVGLPPDFSITNLVFFNDYLIVTTSEGKVKKN